MRNLIIVTALATLFPSCRSFPEPQRFIVFEQCSPFIVMKSETEVDLEQSACFCREYQYSLNQVGAVTDGVDKPLAYCNKIVGPTIEYYGEVTKFLENLRFDLSLFYRPRQ